MDNKYEEDAFKEYLKNKGLSLDNIDEDKKEEWLAAKYKDYEDEKNNSSGSSNDNNAKSNEDTTQNDTFKVSENQSNDAKEPNIKMHEEHSAPAPENWIEKKRNSWQPWCEKEHNPPYVYDENKAVKDGLEFDVYKTPEDKAAGKKAVSVYYKDPHDVTLTSEEGKVPDYEFFSKLTKEAKADKIPGVTFDGEMTPEFKARLAVACLENGLSMENGPENIDAKLLGQNVSDELKAKIETYNNEQFYNKAKEEAKAYKADKNNDGKPFEIKDKTPSEAAMLFAAYANEGVRVKGGFEAVEQNGGYFPTENLDFMSKEEKQPLLTHNERQKAITTARGKLADLKAGKNLDVSDEEKALLQERLDFDKTRENGGLTRKDGQARYANRQPKVAAYEAYKQKQTTR